MTLDFNAAPAGYAIPETWTLSPDDRAYITNTAWQFALRGVNDPEEYVECFEIELKEAQVSSAEATTFFEQLIELRRSQQKSWGQIPQSRLTQAFAELATIGVIAREDFTCCGTCGAAEIDDERDDSRQWRGYLFYHSQDTDNIFESNSTYVGYGVFLDAYYTEKEWKKIKKKNREAVYTEHVLSLMDSEVIPVLEKHGVSVEWDRSLDTRILLNNVDFVAAI